MTENSEPEIWQFPLGRTGDHEVDLVGAMLKLLKILYAEDPKAPARVLRYLSDRLSDPEKVKL